MEIILGTYQGALIFLHTDFDSIRPISNLSISQNSIKSICATSTGYLIAGGYDQQLHVIDLRTHQEKVQAKQNTGQITKIAQLSQKLFAVGVEDGRVRLWTSNSWTILNQGRFHKKAITGIVSRSNKLIVTAGGSKIILWTVKQFKKVYQYRFGQGVDIEHIALSQDIKWIYYCNSKGEICSIFTQNNQQKTLLQIIAPRKIQDFVLYHNFIIIANDVGEIMAWQLLSEQAVQPLQKLDVEKRIWFKAHNSRIKQIKVIQDLYLLIVTAAGDISMWDFPQFLDSVQHISQNYFLDGLKALCETQVKGRILCVDVFKGFNQLKKQQILGKNIKQEQNELEKQQSIDYVGKSQQLKKSKKNKIKKTKLIEKYKKQRVQQMSNKVKSVANNNQQKSHKKNKLNKGNKMVQK